MEKIDLVVYKKDEKTFKRLVDSLSELSIPEQIEIELLEVYNEENNIAKAFNEAMSFSKSKYKVYVCGDIDIENPDIVIKMFNVLQENSKIGLVGTQGHNVIFTNGKSGDKQSNSEVDLNGNPIDILSVDCCFIMTQYDVTWREDYSESPSLLIAAQCVEMRRRGYYISSLDNNENWYTSIDGDSNISQNAIDKFLDDYSLDLFPLVSVIIPTHERVKWFKIALDSVLNQTYKNIEIRISDNSKDNDTEQLVKEYQTTYSNIYYSHIPGAGMLDNWVNQFEFANGDYINYLMDDDVFLPNKISEMINYFLVNPQVRLVTSYRKLISEEGEELPDCEFNAPLFDKTQCIPGELGGRILLTNSFNWIGELTTALFRKGTGDDQVRIGGWSGKEKYFLSDYSLWLQLMEKGDIIYISHPLSLFRQHGGNGAKNFNARIKGSLAMATVIQEAWNRRCFINCVSDLRKAIASWYRMTIAEMVFAYEHGSVKDDFDCLRRVFIDMSNHFVMDEPNNFEILEQEV